MHFRRINLQLPGHSTREHLSTETCLCHDLEIAIQPSRGALTSRARPERFASGHGTPGQLAGPIALAVQPEYHRPRMSTMSIAAPPVGSIVAVRGRDWIVMPSLQDDVALLRPLTGGDPIGVFLPLEGQDIRPATFPPPDPAVAGDSTGVRLLRDAFRLSLRAAAAPFRSLGQIDVTPRPYQFVPLIMALRQLGTRPAVRLLIADDVGVGKTIEAALVARELLDSGAARRIAVLCPTHLCEQWEEELRTRVGIHATIVQPSRMARLERDLPSQGSQVFSYYQHLVCSIDYVKNDRLREPFIRNAPDLLIVDEAHIASRPAGRTGRSADQQRYELVSQLAARQDRHVLLVTATPHSGIDENFRSILGLLDPRFDGEGPPPDRRDLLPYVVQRRRDDLRSWLGATTPFPERDSREQPYHLSPAYERLFQDVLEFCRETVNVPGEAERRQRVRYWGAIALLRCVLSSPAAAAAAFAARAASRDLDLDDADPGLADDEFQPQVMDVIDDDRSGDYLPSGAIEEGFRSEQRRLATFLRRARELQPSGADAKLQACLTAIRDLLKQGYHPIVFCRYIATAGYVGQALRDALSSTADVQIVTSEDPDAVRRERIDGMDLARPRVLVVTDCLSEGINLQERFDAVVHYDLPWNPNRLEQREGRVDRFGQQRETVRTITLYADNNEVDAIVLDVLLRKAKAIRQSLGISVPVPGDSEAVLKTVIERVLLGRGGGQAGRQGRMNLGDAVEAQALEARWDLAAVRQKETRTFFAQHGIRPDEVQQELEQCDPVLGTPGDLADFLRAALPRYGGSLEPLPGGRTWKLVPGNLLDGDARIVTFEAPAPDGSVVLGRTHPDVRRACERIIADAMAGTTPWLTRASAIATRDVQRVTAILGLRVRYRLTEPGRRASAAEQYAEEILTAAFATAEGGIQWLPADAVAPLLDVRPAASLDPAERQRRVQAALDRLDQAGRSWWQPLVQPRVAELEDAHHRLRKLARQSALRVTPAGEPDILTLTVLVPA